MTHWQAVVGCSTRSTPRMSSWSLRARSSCTLVAKSRRSKCKACGWSTRPLASSGSYTTKSLAGTYRSDQSAAPIKRRSPGLLTLQLRVLHHQKQLRVKLVWMRREKALVSAWLLRIPAQWRRTEAPLASGNRVTLQISDGVIRALCNLRLTTRSLPTNRRFSPSGKAKRVRCMRRHLKRTDKSFVRSEQRSRTLWPLRTVRSET
mmetsp:Transcript_73231/g.129865  ORF Transcript_73231/g.129865 Transcript_73231/m.129865 type:complete len:205 (+) Transcript_73231:1161-1775(+)